MVKNFRTTAALEGITVKDWIQIDSEPALWLQYHKVHNRDDEASVDPWTPDWEQPAPVSTRERTMRYRTQLAAPDWLKRCLLGGLPSVAVVDNQQVCVGKDASDAQLLQRPIICPPGGLRYAFATLVWKMHNAAAPCGSPTVQMDVHLTVTVESPWLWAFQSRIEKVFVSKVEQDIKIYLAFMAAVISQRAELHKAPVSSDRADGSKVAAST